MNYGYRTEGSDEQGPLMGDPAFVRVRSRQDPRQLQPGELADAVNVRLDKWVARTRGGVRRVPNHPVLDSHAPLLVPFTVGDDAVIRDVYTNGVFAACEYMWGPRRMYEPELIVGDNVTMASDTGWWTLNDAAIGAGVATVSAIDGYLQRAAVLVPGKYYQARFTVGGYVSGDVGISAVTTSDAGRLVNADGVHVVEFLHDGASEGVFRLESAVADVTFDDVEVREYWVTTAGYEEYLSLFTADRCYLFRAATADLQEIMYEAGEALARADVCSAVAANGKVYLMRGAGKTVLEWDGDVDSEFVPVDASAAGGTLVRMPNLEWGVWARQRMVVPNGPWELLLSDVGDPDSYDTVYRQFRTGWGTDDVLMSVVEWRDDTLVVGYKRSIHVITGLSTLTSAGLGTAAMLRITNEAGVAARRSLMVWGNRVWWISHKGVYGLEITEDVRLRGVGKPLSDAVDWFEDVNWEAIGSAHTVIDGEERIGFCVPTGTAVRPNSIFWYSVINDADGRGGWECRDTFADGFFLDYILRTDVEGKQRLVVVNREGGAYWLDEQDRAFDEVGGVGTAGTVGTRVIPVMLLTREYSQGQVMVWSEAEVDARVEDDAVLEVDVVSRDDAYERGVLEVSGDSNALNRIRRAPLRIRGAGVQLRLEGVGNIAVSAVRVWSRTGGRRARWKQ